VCPHNLLSNDIISVVVTNVIKRLEKKYATYFNNILNSVQTHVTTVITFETDIWHDLHLYCI